MPALTHEFTYSLPASPECVFAALTRPEEMRKWFAEHADVEPHVGGAYHFWGKHTYGALKRASATQRIVQIESPRLLCFSWRLEGADSEVTLELSPDAASGAEPKTTLKGRHHFQQTPQVPRVKDLVEDLWKLTASNLMAYLAGGDGLLLPDFTDPAPCVRISILIDAPRERVFKALLDPATLNRWIASAAVVEPRVGGHYRYGWNYKVGDRDVVGGPTKILEFVESERLVTDWPDWRGDPTLPITAITWLLESVGDKTRVTLIHGVFERTVDISDYGPGWYSLLTRLKSMAESISEPEANFRA
jgi:uncharacterized protein YndB with AHSA1/START domain